MPLLIDEDERTRDLVAAINDLLVAEGPTSLTLRRIARASAISPSSVLHHYGSREHLIRVAAAKSVRGRLDGVRERTHREGVLAFLPLTSDQVLDARAWLAWQEIWRAEESIVRPLDEVRADERSWLARLSAYRAGPDDLDLVLALVEGLTAAVCRPVRPMRVTTARRHLSDQVRRLGLFGPVPDEHTDPAIPDVTLLARHVSSLHRRGEEPR